LHFDKKSYLDGLWRLLERLEGEAPPYMAEANRLTFGYINQLFLLDDDEKSDLHRFATLLFSHAGQLRGCPSPAEIAQLLRKLTLRASVSSDEQAHGSIPRAMDVIDRHLSDPNLSLDFVAAQIGLSPSYFSRLFKNATQQNYTDYIVEKRIALADELRGSTKLKASEIAARVGYTNLRYFSKLYKRHTGHSIGRREA
jgi:two-component system response regulator YesN